MREDGKYHVYKYIAARTARRRRGGGDDDDDEAATRWRGLVSGVAATFEPGWPRVSARAGLAFVGCYDATMTTPLASS